MALDPESWSGHHRLGEIQLQTSNYQVREARPGSSSIIQEALAAFQRAFQCHDSDKVVCKELMDKSKRELAIDLRQGQ